MRLAIIDLGTNSVRFDIHEIGPQNQVFRLHREKLMIRLGEGVFLKGRLDAKSNRICIDAFHSFAKSLQDFRVQRVVAFATSALREAKDAEKLIRRIARETGIQVKIISGEEEARLIAKGVLDNEHGLRGKYALVDIGGGSTEVSVCSGKKVLNSASFPLGTARLQQVFLKTIPPKLGKDGRYISVENLRRHIRGILLYRLVSDEWPKVSRIIGSSGTIRAISRIFKKKTGLNYFSRSSLNEFVQSILPMTREELARIPGMEARRIDMILAGAILLQECMHSLHADRVELTEFTLRDGILDDQIDKMKQEHKLIISDPIKDLYQTAKDLGSTDAQLKQAQKISEELFNKLRPLHRLAPEWRKYLVAASLLGDTGRSISPIDAEFHSAYIARYADLPAFQDWESKLISELCFQRRNGKIMKKDLPFRKDPQLRRVYLRLLAILRVATALSFQRENAITIERVKIDPKRVRLILSRRNSPDLAILRADQRKQIFEDVFRKELVIEQN